MKALILMFISSMALCDEIHYLGRSVKGLLMGDAYTTLADDEYTLFYNPAILGGHKGLSFTPLPPKLSVTNALDEMDGFEDFPSSDAADIADRIIGFPIHFQVGAYPSLKFSRIAMTLFANSSLNMNLRNGVYPQMDINYNYDRGFVFGYAHNIRGNERGSRTSIGLSIKNVNRSSLKNTFDLFGTKLLNIVSDEEVDGYKEIRERLGYSYGKGWGFDLGFEEVLVAGPSSLKFGFSVLDAFDTKYRKVSGLYSIPDQKMIVQTGLSFSQNFILFDYKLSLDLHPLNQEMDFMRKVHVGVDFGLPLVRLLAGWSGGYKSYGVSLNLWPIKIMAGFYSVEQGRTFKEEEGSRAIIYLSLLDFSFDG